MFSGAVGRCSPDPVVTADRLLRGALAPHRPVGVPAVATVFHVETRLLVNCRWFPAPSTGREQVDQSDGPHRPVGVPGRAALRLPTREEPPARVPGLQGHSRGDGRGHRGCVGGRRLQDRSSLLTALDDVIDP